MVIVKIQGGLGNQMFQYARGQHISRKYGVEVLYDISFYSLNLNPKREFLLNNFNNININTNCNNIDNQYYCKVYDNFIFTELKNIGSNDYYLDGYWQSEKYFKGTEQELKNDFKISDEILCKISDVLLGENNVSIHVRRTDYLNSNGVHPIIDIDYYEHALKLLNQYDYIYVFSDDMEWCKRHLKFSNMVFIDNFNEIESLYLMSLCNNNIIANSTFSWWGAWLNNNKDKKIFAPKKWFGDHVKLNTKDIMPIEWVTI